MRLGVLLMSLMSFTTSKSDTFTMGYLTGSQRLPGDLEYQRPGLTISGAISLAVDEVNRDILGPMGHKLDFIVAETYGVEKISVKETADLRVRNVSVYIGPQETCEHEAYLAASFNLPMISYFCTHNETSDKTKYSTFARTRPPDSQISKSVASVLTTFNWTHVSFSCKLGLRSGKGRDIKIRFIVFLQVVLLYLKSSDSEFGHIATIILHSLHAVGVTVVAARSWDTPYHHEYAENPFHKLVEDTYRDTRREYFVIGVDINQYDKQNPTAYFRGLLREENDPEAPKAFRNYIGVVASSPVGFENFTNLVNSYMVKEPFNFPNPLKVIGQGKKIRAEAAFLYDAVHIYAKALQKVLKKGEDPENGTAIINYMKRTCYRSAMG
ncbi:guanylyl cyclase [Holotrichia oblita]|uniref:Guanylyl cyclase n=1 Tax=Holotrichia oblita TaxID=644536 RepID=A0ACB9T2U6_HOLOL|nr:guanylyl cyclase [Holotrichia oblita]